MSGGQKWQSSANPNYTKPVRKKGKKALAVVAAPPGNGNGKAHLPFPGTHTPEFMASIRPAQPHLTHRLHAEIAAEAQAEAEAKLLAAHRHLNAERDGDLIRTLASLNLVLPRAWHFFLTHAKLAEAADGQVTWTTGLGLLLTLEEKRMRLCAELLLSPKSRKLAGMPVLPEDVAHDVTLDGLRQRYTTPPRAEKDRSA